ncbi:hypothetical protein J4221_00725 [Candidatus Pacearchaeota archaeon]|nr:hypothetical protein [Candidatus Pacearchaeota archaeon]
MFGRYCSHCRNKVKEDYDYCPFCGESLKTVHDKEDYGFLGRNDFVDSDISFSRNPVGNLFENAMRILEKQMKSFQKELLREAKESSKEHNRLNIQFFVNGKRVLPEKIGKEAFVRVRKDSIIQEKLKNASTLPKKEPEARLKRLSGRIVYEIPVPGVKSVDDVLINQLENSIEIKALSDNQIYHKNLKVNLPVMRYDLKNEILILELQSFMS